jgi:hypothetical protein
MKLNFERDDCGLGLASLRHLGNDNTALDECGADLCPALCPIHIGWHCRGRRRRRAGSGGADAAAVRQRLKRVQMTGWMAETVAEVLAAVVVGRGGRMVANATGLLKLSNLKRLAESGAVSHPVVTARIPHWCPTDIPTRFTRFHVKATIRQEAATVVGLSGTIQASEK